MVGLALEDPLNYTGKVRLGTGITMLDAMATLTTRLAETTVPLLFVHGTSDIVTYHPAAVQVFKAASSQDKTFVTYEDLFHGMFAEPERMVRTFLQDIMAWVHTRAELPPAKTRGVSELLRRDSDYTTSLKSQCGEPVDESGRLRVPVYTEGSAGTHGST
jgi:hypothetical protein